MLGGVVRQVIRTVAAAAVATALVSGCATGGGPAATSVPTFPEAGGTTAAPAAGAVDSGVLPRDCERLLGVADLGALLGLPLDGVAVRSTVGVAAPSVGRTERLDCSYTGTAAAGPARGATLLGLGVAAYDDAAAAAKQWRLNADAQDGDRRDIAIGAANAVLVQRSDEALLTVVHGSGTLTFVLPRRAQPPGRDPGDVLVDMALRVLPALPRVAPSSAPPAVTSSGPAQAAGPS